MKKVKNKKASHHRILTHWSVFVFTVALIILIEGWALMYLAVWRFGKW